MKSTQVLEGTREIQNALGNEGSITPGNNEIININKKIDLNAIVRVNKELAFLLGVYKTKKGTE